MRAIGSTSGKAETLAVWSLQPLRSFSPVGDRVASGRAIGKSEGAIGNSRGAIVLPYR